MSHMNSKLKKAFCFAAAAALTLSFALPVRAQQRYDDPRAWEAYAQRQNQAPMSDELPARATARNQTLTTETQMTARADWSWIAIDYDGDNLVDAVERIYLPALNRARQASMNEEVEVRDGAQPTSPMIRVVLDMNQDRQFETVDRMMLDRLREARFESQRMLVESGREIQREERIPAETPARQEMQLQEEIPAREGTPRQPQAEDQTRAMTPYNFDPSRIYRVEGVVIDLDVVEGAGFGDTPHYMALVEMINGRIERVDLGPVSELTALDLTEGDRIRTFGPLTVIGGVRMLTAERIEAVGEVYLIDRAPMTDSEMRVPIR